MDLWLKYRVENNYWVNDPKEPYATSNLLARHVLPRLGDIGINAITVEDIRVLEDGVAFTQMRA